MNLTLLIGGISLFIYSIDYLTSNLALLSLNKVKEKLNTMTSSTFKSLSTGFLATTIIQSSSAVIILTISLINAKIISFNSSIGIMLGSNVATTITSFITGLNLEKISAYIMLIGLILSFFKTKKTGKIIFSIGLLFYSLFLTSIAINNIKNSTNLYSYIQSVSTSFILSIIVGALITLILQSSSIFVAILQILSSGGLLTIYQAIPFIFGANIGTTFDSFYGLINSNKEAKKLAHFNLIFNISTVILFSIFISPFKYLINFTINLLNTNTAISIAIINILFNTIGVLLIIPFLNKIKRYYAKW